MGPVCYSERISDGLRFLHRLFRLTSEHCGNLSEGLSIPGPAYHLLNFVSGGPGMSLILQVASPLT